MRRTILLLSVSALLLVSCSETDEGQDAQPTGAAQASASALAATGSLTPSPTSGKPLALAPDRFVAVIEANIAALNAGDEQAYAATWAEEGEFNRHEWSEDVAGFVGSMSVILHPETWQLERTGGVIFVPRISRPAGGGMRVIENGPYAAHTFSCVNEKYPEYTFPGIAVYQFDDHSKIVHQWVMAPGRKWVGGCY